MPASEAHESGRTKVRHQQESPQPVSSPEQIATELAAGPETTLLTWERGLGGAFSQATFERHAKLLGDPRLSQSMYARQRSEIVRKIQHDYGNHYVQRLVDHIQQTKTRDAQTKLAVGPAGDSYEREADQVARQVMGRINANSHVSVQRADEEEDEALRKPLLQRQVEEESVQAKPILQRQVGAEGGDADSEVDQAVNQARGHGRPLPDDVRDDMETAFEADFSGVKVHTGDESDALNNSVSARAFTTGQDIFFRDGDYNPESKSGQELIAHELTHVVQQGNGIQRFYTDLKAKPEKEWTNEEVRTYIDKLLSRWKGIAYPKSTRIEKAIKLLDETPYEFKDMVNFRYKGVFGEEIGKEEEEADQPPAEKNYIPEDEIPDKINDLKGLHGKLETDYKENVQLGGLPDEGLLAQVQEIMTGIPADESDKDFERVKAEWSETMSEFRLADPAEVTTAEEEPEEEEENLEIEVTFAQASWKVEGFSGHERSFKGSHGSGEANLGAGGEASAEASVTSKQAMAKFAAEFFVGAKAKLEGKASFGGENNALELKGALEGSLGLGADFSAEFSAGLEGIKASISASAFAGLKGSAEATATVKLGGREIATLTGKIEGTIGVGGEAKLEFALTQDDLVFKFGASATLGIGGGGEIGISVNLANVAMTIIDETSKLRSAYREGYRRDLDVQQIDNEATMRRSIAALKSMIDKLETRVEAVESGSETVSLLQ